MATCETLAGIGGEAGVALSGLLAVLALDGVLRLPLSTSPEILGNGPRAWLKPNTNCDLACLKMLFLALTEMGDACGEKAEARERAAAARALGGFHLDTYPGHSLRMITRDPWVGFDAKLPAGQRTHVAATADGETSHTALYVNGKLVTQTQP